MHSRAAHRSCAGVLTSRARKWRERRLLLDAFARTGSRARACDAGDDATPTNAQVLLIVDTTLAHTMMAMDGRISFEY